jgi:transmembrane sensor
VETNKVITLILDKITGELTVEDSVVLDAWQDADPGNRELLDRLSDFSELSQDLTMYGAYDTEQVSRKIEKLLAANKINLTTQVSTKMREASGISFLIRNAAAVILLAVTFYYFFSKGDKVSGPQNVEATNHMPPGMSKAVLTLSNGQTVALQSAEKELIREEGQTIRNKAGQLTYGTGTKVVYNTLNTPRGGQFRIRLSDGTAIWLNAASAIRYPTSFTGAERLVEVEGEVYFEVAPDKLHPFIVRGMRDSIKVTVTGTHFNVNTYKDDGSLKITLLEGRVKVAVAGKEKILLPGEQAQSFNNNIHIQENVDVEEIMAWKNGQFIFGEKESIEAIMKQLARWYDIDVAYNGKVTQYFWGSMSRSSDGIAVLKMLEETGAVKFEVTGRKVIVSPAKK